MEIFFCILFDWVLLQFFNHPFFKNLNIWSCKKVIPVTDLPVVGCSMGSNMFSNVASPCDRAPDSIKILSCCSRFCYFACMFGMKTTHNNIGQLVWELHQKYKVLCPASRDIIHKQVSSTLQQYKEDDPLLVAIDTQHHQKTIFERCFNGRHRLWPIPF